LQVERQKALEAAHYAHYTAEQAKALNLEWTAKMLPYELPLLLEEMRTLEKFRPRLDPAGVKNLDRTLGRLYKQWDADRKTQMELKKQGS